MKKTKDLTGRRYGRLKVIGPAGSDKRWNRLYHCVCDCGRETIVRGYNLKNDRTKSCGCLRVELAKAIIRQTKQIQARMAKRVKLFKEGRE